jgi:hypothetical protein
VLLGTLTAGWLLAGRRAPPPPVPEQPAAAVPATPATMPAVVLHDTTELRARLDRSSQCVGVAAREPRVRCAIDHFDVDARLVDDAGAAFRRAVGDPPAGTRGAAPACAHGNAEERAWSHADAPDTPAGRYRCRIERGHAAMWWTDGDLLVHAVARNGDLAALFAWWRAQPS